MDRRSRSWALGLSIIGFFALLFSVGFVQQVKADDVQDYGTVIGIVRAPPPPRRYCHEKTDMQPRQDLGTTYS